MITVRLTERLGNQMFQYAAARALAERLRTTLSVDVLSYVNHSLCMDYKLWRFSRLSLQSLPVQSAISLHQRVMHAMKPRPIFLMKRLGVDESVMHLDGCSVIEGYFQSERYFEDHTDLIRDIYDLSTFLCPHDVSRVRALAQGRTPVSLHIRRGDYVGNKMFYLGDLSRYYSRCITMIQEAVNYPFFVVFSDDPNYCKSLRFLTQQNSVVIRDESSTCPLKDMALMAFCDHHILANSSFSWWAGWLGQNPQKQVFLPRTWLNDLSTDECGLDVPGWTQIDI